MLLRTHSDRDLSVNQTEKFRDFAGSGLHFSNFGKSSGRLKNEDLTPCRLARRRGRNAVFRHRRSRGHARRARRPAGRSKRRHEADDDPPRERARREIRGIRAPPHPEGDRAGGELLAAGGRRREGLRRGRDHLPGLRLDRPQRLLFPDGEVARVPRRPHERDLARLQVAVGPRSRRDLPVRRGPRRLRPLGPLRRRLVPQPPRLRRAPELPGHHPPAAARPGARVDAPAVGRGAPGRALLQARSRLGQPGDHRGGRRGRPVHRAVQHLDAPPRRRQGHAPLPAEDAPALALEPARPDQGRLLGQERPRQAAPDRAGDGPHRHADDPRRRRRQPLRRLGPGARTPSNPRSSATPTRRPRPT